MDETPEDMDYHMILLKYKMILNAKINVLVYFSINTSSLLYSLRLQGGGSIVPLNPPLHPVGVLLVLAAPVKCYLNGWKFIIS